jgi:predicted transcriptional regulator
VIRNMVSARQIRAARALLGWSQETLAERAIISVSALRRLELGETDPRISTLSAVQTTLENACIVFIAASTSQGEGVRLSRPD